MDVTIGQIIDEFNDKQIKINFVQIATEVTLEVASHVQSPGQRCSTQIEWVRQHVIRYAERHQYSLKYQSISWFQALSANCMISTCSTILSFIKPNNVDQI